MPVIKLLSHFALAILTFGLAIGVVASVQYVTSPRGSAPPDLGISEMNMSGVYYVAPSTGNTPGCLDRGEIHPFGRDAYLESAQMPPLKRTMRDGRWFILETENQNGTSYEFFGILPDSIGGNKVAVLGKLIRITNGDITGDTDATFYAVGCSLK